MQLVAITQRAHTSQRWVQPKNFAFAAKQTVLPLVASELAKAALSLPIAFVAQNDSYLPMAVLGIKGGQNLFVAPDGRWIGRHVPSSIRWYPFHLAASDGGEQVLCIDEDSGLLGPTGEPFFQEGAPTQAIRDILTELAQTRSSQQLTIKACASLQAHRLIVPWPITVQGEQGNQQLEGLFKIDEAALMQLPGDALHDLMQTGGLALAYCQMLSVQHLPVLGELAQAQATAAAQQVQAPPPPFAGDTLKLG